jgi:hypothetical protein
MNDFYLDNKVREGTILAFLGEWGSGMLSRLLPREVEATVVSQSSLVDALMEVEENLKEEKSCFHNMARNQKVMPKLSCVSISGSTKSKLVIKL